ncbi:helix-turn-helix domain-containing protein [Thalassospira australica]|uniref:helix-turn-helix domain-containing protein n=1 Tax=Thalassospira australica TaxID=1528106 RepID=UPI0038512920
MNDIYDYLDLIVAVAGIAQAAFLCLLLRSEGARALRANRWMMLFLAAVAFNLFEDIAEVFFSPQSYQVVEMIFIPANFLIAPAVYLYFREVSGVPSRQPWVHFVLAGVILNLMAWSITNGMPISDNFQHSFTVPAAISSFCWFAIFAQAGTYVLLIWKVAHRYFRQAQEQLGVDRNAMRRWMGVILGGVSLIFLTTLIGKIAAFFFVEDLAMSGTGVAFVLLLFALSYEIATQPVLFVMPDWPGEGEADEDDEDLAKPAEIAENSGVSASGTSGASDASAGSTESISRPLLDDDGVALARRRLDEIRKRGDLLLDPLVSLPKLARSVGVSPNQLSYVLNHHVGQNFFDYVNGARIEEARAVLIAEPDRTILDVALSVGFNSKSTFNLAFKKLTGDTPSAVRALARAAATNPPSEPPRGRPDGQGRTPDAAQ